MHDLMAISYLSTLHESIVQDRCLKVQILPSMCNLLHKGISEYVCCRVMSKGQCTTQLAFQWQKAIFKLLLNHMTGIFSAHLPLHTFLLQLLWKQDNNTTIIN